MKFTSLIYCDIKNTVYEKINAHITITSTLILKSVES